MRRALHFQTCYCQWAAHSTQCATQVISDIMSAKLYESGALIYRRFAPLPRLSEFPHVTAKGQSIALIVLHKSSVTHMITGSFFVSKWVCSLAQPIIDCSDLYWLCCTRIDFIFQLVGLQHLIQCWMCSLSCNHGQNFRWPTLWFERVKIHVLS